MHRLKKNVLSAFFLSSNLITSLCMHCEACVCCVCLVLQLQRRGSTMSSTPMPPVSRLGLYEIKGLLLSFLHIVKTLSEGRLTDWHRKHFLYLSALGTGVLNILQKGLLFAHHVSMLQFAAVLNLAFKHCFVLPSKEHGLVVEFQNQL